MKVSQDNPSMQRKDAVDLQTQRELLHFTLSNARRSLLPLLFVMSYVVLVGWQAGAHVPALGVAGLGLISGIWRWWAAGQFQHEDQDVRWVVRAGRAVEGNAAVVGLAWVLANAGIYPALNSSQVSIYVAVICGATAVATYFLATLGRAFLILMSLQLGSFVLANLWMASLNSLILALLAMSFALTSYRAAIFFRHITVSALQRGREVDEANAALRSALEAAQAANLAKSQFLATMSHEIRTPMNGVLGALELLQHSPLDPRQMRLVQTASSSGSTLMGILNEVLDHSKIEAGRLDLAPTPVSLKALATSVLSLLRSNAEAKGLALTLERSPQAPDGVMVDGQRHKQVLLNLVGNAIKFTEHGGVSLILAPASSSVEGCLGVRIEVHDSGPGIDPRDVLSIFEPFHQGSSSQRRGGTGLGLSICQRIVEAMGGRIELSSTLGRGSSFSFVLHLPLAPASDPEHEAMAPNGSCRMSGTVLVVEDNAVNRMIASELLVSLGLRVLTAENGALALSVLEQQSVDLVLMDVQMPVLNGYEATRAIRERESCTPGAAHVPIVALTANAFAADIALAHAAGMDAHLAKPYSRDELESLLRRLL